jgi:hypothetical protein
MKYVITTPDQNGTDGKLPIINDWLPSKDTLHVEMDDGRVSIPLYEAGIASALDGDKQLEEMSVVLGRIPDSKVIEYSLDSERKMSEVPDYMTEMRDEMVEEYGKVLTPTQISTRLVSEMKRKHNVIVSPEDALEGVKSGLDGAPWKRKEAFWDAGLREREPENQSAQISAMYNKHSTKKAAAIRACDLLAQLPGKESPNALMVRVGRFVSTIENPDRFAFQLRAISKDSIDYDTPDWLKKVTVQADKASEGFPAINETVREIARNLGEEMKEGNDYKNINLLTDIFQTLEAQSPGRGEQYAHFASFNKNRVEIDTPDSEPEVRRSR